MKEGVNSGRKEWIQDEGSKFRMKGVDSRLREWIEDKWNGLRMKGVN